MKFKLAKKYIYWGITGFTVLAAAILFNYGVSRLSVLGKLIHTTWKVLTPIIYGFIIAYLLAPAVNFIEKKIFRTLFAKFNIQIEEKKRLNSACRMFAILITFALTFFVIYQLMYMLIPELIKSISNMISSAPAYWAKLEEWSKKLLKDNPAVEAVFLKYLDSGLEYLTKDLLPHVNEILMNFSVGIWDFVVVLKNIAIGCIVSIYILNSKEKFAAGCKKALYSMFSCKKTNLFLHNLRFVHTKVGGFIIGKLLDSFIIGCICFMVLSIMKMPYSILISVIIGVTNVIPFFGPYIGAIPCAFLILIMNPIQCIYFIIFILILQTFDGNVLGPKILSESTDLTSFWIIFAILIGGGLFGIVGMFIGVPLFAVVYAVINSLIDHSLHTKELSTDVDKYMDLKSIELRELPGGELVYEFKYLNGKWDEFKSLKFQKIKNGHEIRNASKAEANGQSKDHAKNSNNQSKDRAANSDNPSKDTVTNSKQPSKGALNK